MKRLSLITALLISFVSIKAEGWIRINQLGYLPHSVKVAVLISDENVAISDFQVCKALTGEVVFNGRAIAIDGAKWGMKTSARLNFSPLETAGGFYIKAAGFRSPVFRIAPDVYEGTAGYILKYMRQQRCGYNPFLKDSCHTHDGMIVDHPTRTGEIIDVKGGWHDATDYLQYVTTSANAVYQMLFAYSKNPEAYKDEYNASGLPGSNGIPDILDEVRWGVDWLLKMNPDSGIMFNQIADDRDHRGFRLPNKDTVSYGKGLYRPVYFITGKPQGLGAFKNRATGVSSTAGKYSSVFALAAQTLRQYDAALAKTLEKKAVDAFEFGLTDLGVAQTACVVSPYFYEEDNYIDDLELAASELYKLTGDRAYLKQADYWGALEPVTPWMGRDTARHYQYYPFVNLGHANLAHEKNEGSKDFVAFMRKGLQGISDKGQNDPFSIGIPFIWCSNNFVAAAITQCRLYFQASGDSSFIEMEASLRDWLFGCNPWGTSMICGLPEGGDYPLNPHSSIRQIMKQTTYGGLVDGPVYNTIFKNLKGIDLKGQDPYSAFQHGLAVYHDDIGDYSTNEPTMDGTASLSFYLSFLEKEGLKAGSTAKDKKDAYGAIVRKGMDKKEIRLIFSADEFGEGADEILKTLEKKKVKASFFLTGNFLRNEKFAPAIKKMIKDNHYVGGHSDKHLLYMNWENRDSVIITKDEFENDLRANYAELSKFGIVAESATTFMAPYEWYNSTIAHWTGGMGLQLINFTPGTGTNADYTTPDMKNYKSSQVLLDQLMKFEASSPDRLNGAIILVHLGTHPDRTDKFYSQLGTIIDLLKKKGYSFNRF
ncbi:MAG TPA: glycoside hydrolase family 9 protein [Bacteroidales bacterium]|nr:glycoside hydrolase family 9 protein [Bacteroidales bacterium]